MPSTASTLVVDTATDVRAILVVISAVALLAQLLSPTRYTLVSRLPNELAIDTAVATRGIAVFIVPADADAVDTTLEAKRIAVDSDPAQDTNELADAVSGMPVLSVAITVFVPAVSEEENVIEVVRLALLPVTTPMLAVSALSISKVAVAATVHCEVPCSDICVDRLADCVDTCADTLDAKGICVDSPAYAYAAQLALLDNAIDVVSAPAIADAATAIATGRIAVVNDPLANATAATEDDTSILVVSEALVVLSAAGEALSAAPLLTSPTADTEETAAPARRISVSRLATPTAPTLA